MSTPERRELSALERDQEGLMLCYHAGVGFAMDKSGMARMLCYADTIRVGRDPNSERFQIMCKGYLDQAALEILGITPTLEQENYFVPGETYQERLSAEDVLDMLTPQQQEQFVEVRDRLKKALDEYLPVYDQLTSKERARQVSSTTFPAGSFYFPTS